MIADPYKVLGLSPDATDDQVKAAYRKLAKKYHPDVNQGSPQAEAKMKEINEAYDQIIKHKNANTSGYGGYGASGGAGTSGGYGWSGSSGNWGGWGASGWGSYGTGGQQQGSPQMQAARNYINFGHYREALNVLANISERNARWYFYSAAANAGLGNRVAALNYAQQAVNMDPNNLEYRSLLQQIQRASQPYQAQGRQYGMPNLNNACTWLCLSQLCCSFCGGGRFFCC